MRAMLTAAVGLMACFTLFGCDQNPQQAQTATPVAVTPPPAPCNCRQAAAPPVIRVAHHREYRRRYGYYSRYEHYDHHGHHGHTLSEFLAYSTGPSSYSESESTSSVREYRPGDEQRYSEQRYSESGYSETRGSGAQYQQSASAQAAWVDGYGKTHYGDYGPPEDEHPGLISGKDQHERDKPWRGYDSKCSNN